MEACTGTESTDPPVQQQAVYSLNLLLPSQEHQHITGSLVSVYLQNGGECSIHIALLRAGCVQLLHCKLPTLQASSVILQATGRVLLTGSAPVWRLSVVLADPIMMMSFLCSTKNALWPSPRCFHRDSSIQGDNMLCDGLQLMVCETTTSMQFSCLTRHAAEQSWLQSSRVS